MIEKILNYQDPLNRKEYFVQFLTRLFFFFVIISVFNLIDIGWDSSLTIRDDFLKTLWEDRRGVGIFLSAVLFLPLDIRRVKDINLSTNWIYIYYTCLFLPFPEDSFESGNPVAITFEASFIIFIISFAIYLFIKKGSNRK